MSMYELFFRFFKSPLAHEQVDKSKTIPNCSVHFVQLIEAETGQGMFCAVNLELAKCLADRVNGNDLVNLANHNISTRVIYIVIKSCKVI